ncbi:hypothetical protein BDN72DRAFT_819242 [Pluteus cervinus]|uniref:Uncharacterized protein n=1 Tax=Pluteus cervinus TaxID=181527 RepID=A0ACD3AY00_9AGAR|nr:hypothetical protein BDN72DRAFT_819242 [Pluteus cervinus]
MSTIANKIEAVGAAIVKRPPFCSGVVGLEAPSSKLFYERQDNSSGLLSLASANTAQLQDLTNACLPATFGLDSKDVYDESYRKARKMDVEFFATKFDPSDLGIVDLIRKGLLEGPNQTKKIGIELYKLNVYDEGSFFKAHKDTPRSEDMFASLVVSFPTPHQGGQLLLRHDGEQWTFDSADILSKPETPSAAWIAFYSDVEHEVTPVTSGHRLTLTYNLYYQEEKTPNIDTISVPDNSSLVTESVPDISLLQAAVASLLQDKRILPDGGYFGFGLRFMYPAFGTKGRSGLQKVLAQLKGSDALLKQVCDTLSLATTLEVVIDNEDEDTEVLVPEALDLTEWQVDSSWDYILKRYGAREVYPWDTDDAPEDADMIMWVTPPTAFPTYDTPYVAYGNEASVAHLYGDICLVAKVGPVDQRETVGVSTST